MWVKVRWDPGESNGVIFAFVCNALRFNRCFLVQWTALWVIRIPCCQLWPFTLKYRLRERVSVFGSGGGRGLVCGNNSRIRTKLNNTHLPDIYTPNQLSSSPPTSLLSIHVYLTETRMVFLLKETELGCHSQEHYFWLTGCASIQTDCPHGYACCHNTPGGSAKSIIL